MSMSDPKITIEILRYRPEQDQEPSFQTYEVDYRDDWLVLDAINHIKDTIDGTLSYRWSCQMGICGSCGMMINGVPKLSCATFLRDYWPGAIKVEPLANFPIERDLVIVMDDFIGKLTSVKPWIIREEEQLLSEGEYLQTPAELARYKQFTLCINCMLCYSACPVYANDPGFLGPAAIALAQRYNLDSRDQGRAQRQEALATEEGIWACTYVGPCTTVCPKGVDPAGAIQQAKLSTAMDWSKSLLMPWGQQ